MVERPLFFARKVVEMFGLLALAFTLQYARHYIASALALALCWQQLGRPNMSAPAFVASIGLLSGWLAHDCLHHQPFKNRRLNDVISLFLGNVLQGARCWRRASRARKFSGFSREWWKDKHNVRRGKCKSCIAFWASDSPRGDQHVREQMAHAEVARLMRCRFCCVDEDYSHKKQNMSVFIVATNWRFQARICT